ncbi:spore protease YyaC [Syntrophothermus sp.]|uniref:spore protease YyaC n=1 Tax=Syntrophothermus sp. TaxID=2736299 RepID=UPI00257D11DA|nr:spore protease YyaC [Syntrophothermus sp.]
MEWRKMTRGRRIIQTFIEPVLEVPLAGTVADPGIGYSWHFEDSLCAAHIRDAYLRLTLELNPRLRREVVILCIGTDRSTGDSLGPLVGTRLVGLGIPGAFVYGTLASPVHATNLVQTLADVNARHVDPFVVALDACLGRTDRVGYINVRPGQIYPGSAVKKELPPVGELHISGVVNVAGFLEHLVLQNTRLHLVYQMAEVIAVGLWQAHRSLFPCGV